MKKIIIKNDYKFWVSWFCLLFVSALVVLIFGAISEESPRYYSFLIKIYFFVMFISLICFFFILSFNKMRENKRSFNKRLNEWRNKLSTGDRVCGRFRNKKFTGTVRDVYPNAEIFVQVLIDGYNRTVPFKRIELYPIIPLKK